MIAFFICFKSVEHYLQFQREMLSTFWLTWGNSNLRSPGLYLFQSNKYILIYACIYLQINVFYCIFLEPSSADIKQITFFMLSLHDDSTYRNEVFNYVITLCLCTFFQYLRWIVLFQTNIDYFFNTDIVTATVPRILYVLQKKSISIIFQVIICSSSKPFFFFLIYLKYFNNVSYWFNRILLCNVKFLC